MSLILACMAMTGCRDMKMVANMAEDLVSSRQQVSLRWQGVMNRVFKDESADVRRETVLIMSYERWWGLSHPPALKAYAVIAGNANEEPTVRCAALRTLGRAGSNAIPYIDNILKALDDKGSHHVRWDAAVALNEIRKRENAWSVQATIASLGGVSTAVSDAARIAWPYKVVQPLLGRLEWDRTTRKGESSPDVRVACAEALAADRRTDVVRKLAEVMESDSDYAVRREAHESLVKIVGCDRGWDPSKWKGDTVSLPAPRARRPWWDLPGLFVRPAPDDGAAG